MRLVLIRHAEAASGEPDELRALTSEGHEQAKRLGDKLRGDGLWPDAVLSSPLLRARETASSLGFAPGATVEDVRAAVEGRGDTVIVIGHQPDCSEIASALGAGPEPKFPPAGVHVLEL